MGKYKSFNCVNWDMNKDEIIEIEWVNEERANELMPYYPEGVESLLEASSPYTFQG